MENIHTNMLATTGLAGRKDHHGTVRFAVQKVRKVVKVDPMGKKCAAGLDPLSRFQRSRPLQVRNTNVPMADPHEGGKPVFSGDRRRSSVYAMPGGFNPERRRSSVCMKPASLGSEKRKGSMSFLDNAPLLKRTHKPTAFQVAPTNRTEVPSTIKEAHFDMVDLTTIINHIRVPPKGVVDIDADTKDLYSPAYAEDIVSYLKSREAKFALPTELLHKHTSVRHSARAILVDWLIQVQDHLELESETLHLTLALLDQMLSIRPMSLIKVQLIGVACLLIASKVVERFPPKMSTLLRLTEEAYDKDELKAAERLVMKALQFDIVLPMPVTFLDRCIKASAHEVDKKKLREINRMSAYLLELAFTDHRLMVRPPSERASAAIWLARRLLLPPGLTVWSRTLAHYSTYQETQLMPLVTRLAALVLNRGDSKYKGATIKYRHRQRYGATSSHPALGNDLLLKAFTKMDKGH